MSVSEVARQAVPVKAQREAQPQAFDPAGIIARYETPLLRYVGEIVGRDAAEDVVQAAFLQMVRQASEEGPSSIRHAPSWLFRVAHNLAMDALRRRGAEKKALGGALGTGSPDAMDAIEEMVRREACEAALAELRRLPEDDRRLILLKIIQGFTMREISAITGLALSCVAGRIDRGLRELARRMREAGLL